MTRHDASAKGGRSKSPAKLAALPRAWAARRAQRRRALPGAAEALDTAKRILGAPGSDWSLRRLAGHLGIAPSTLHRWLAGTHAPTDSGLVRLRLWVSFQASPVAAEAGCVKTPEP